MITKPVPALLCTPIGHGPTNHPTPPELAQALVQKRAARTREALIDAAAELIDDHGMEAAGLHDIAGRAGVSKGALYFRFASKASLISEVRREARRLDLRQARKHLQDSPSALAGAARLSSSLSLLLQQSALVRAGLETEAKGPSAPGGPRHSLHEEWARHLRRQAREDAAQGRLRADVPSDDIARLAAVTSVGIESLGRIDETWWTSEVVDGIGRVLLLFESADSPGVGAVPPHGGISQPCPPSP